MMALLGLLCPSCTLSERVQSLHRYEFRKILMGTDARIVLYAPDDASAENAARAAFDRIDELEQALSDYRLDSEVARVARELRPGTPLPIREDLAHALARSKEIRIRTDGAFDERMGLLTRLWRRARADGAPPPPDEARRAFAQSRVDYELVPGPALLASAPIAFDFGGIGKGLAADEAARVLRSHGIARFLIDMGGDLLAGLPPPGRPGWPVRIEGLHGPADLLLLSERAIATSGPTYQHLVVEGSPLSHILDPRSGRPVDTPRVVSVVCPDAATADALASALSVLGPREADSIAERFPACAWRIEEEAGLYRNEAFRRLEAESAGAHGDEARGNSIRTQDPLPGAL